MRPFSMKDKIGYMFGDFGNDFFFMLVSAFLMVFYTDIFGLDAGTVGVLFLVARLWDAIADVTWGRFIDSRKTKKYGKIQGKFKPWIFRMSVPLVISGVLMFVYIPGMSSGFYYAWAYITYILWGTLYATVNIPFGSMASVMTSDPVERTTLSTFRTMGAMLASLIINAVGPLIVFVDNKIDANRMLMTAVLFGILAIACYLACVTLTTERIEVPEKQPEKGAFMKSLKGLVKNRPLIAILAASLLFMMNTMLVNSVNVYLFKDVFKNASALSVFGLLNTAMTFVAIPIVRPLVEKYGKKELAAVGMLIAGAMYILLFFLPNISLTVFYVIIAIGLFGYAFFNVVVWAFVTDVIDYHEYLTELREDATVYSIYSFARKVGQALAGGIGGFAISAVGYNSAQKVQSQETLDGIYGLGTLVPGIIYLIIAIILIFLYPLTKQRLNQLTVDLAKKRKVKN